MTHSLAVSWMVVVVVGRVVDCRRTTANRGRQLAADVTKEKLPPPRKQDLKLSTFTMKRERVTEDLQQLLQCCRRVVSLTARTDVRSCGD